MTALTPAQFRALRTVAETWPNVRASLIGASALACQMNSYRRLTNDLDLVVAIGVEEADRLARVPGWRPLPAAGEQAWQSPDGVRIDLLPASPGPLEKGVIHWPRSGTEMTLVGLRLAFDANQPLDVGEGLAVLVTAVPAVAVMKMIAFLDRPDREKDLEDLAFLLEEYAEQDRRFDLIGESADLDYENTGAFALGLDVGRLVDAKERAIVERFLADARNEDSRTAARLLRVGPALWRVNEDRLPARLAAFDRGLSGLAKA